MDTNSRVQTDPGDRSGGKILRHRQKFAAKTPYDRPPPPQPAGETDSGSNWLRGLGLPGASRKIFSGATKLLSFMTDDGSSSSSSDSEDDGSCDDIGDDNIPTEIGNPKDKDEITSEMIESFKKQSQQSLLKSDPKWVIEQLLTQVTFSREECDKLIEIIKSRVVDCSATEEGQITGIFETPRKIFGSDGQDLCSKALLEAKNWLDEKKVGSSTKADLDHGLSGFSSIELRHLTKHDVGSPVDMAKSYMLARPPWASPSLRQSGSKTPSPMAINLFKEETPSAGGDSLFSSQKRDTFASGSWNIQDEIRRVRSKATEDLLSSLPSTRIDLSSYALEPKALGHSSVADKIDANVDRMHVSHSSTPTQLVDASVNLAAGLSTCSSALGLAENNLEIEPLSSDQPTIGSEPNQDPECNLKFEGGGVTTNSHDINIGQELLSVQHDAYDESGQRSISTKEVAKVSGPTNANGSASSRSTSLSTGQDIEHPKQSDENNLRPVNSVNDKLTGSVPGEEMCGFLSETLVEIPLENEVKSIVTGSQDNSSTHLKDSTKVDLKHGVIRGKTGSGDEKQTDKKATKYQRKGRGRGK